MSEEIVNNNQESAGEGEVISKEENDKKYMEIIESGTKEFIDSNPELMAKLADTATAPKEEHQPVRYSFLGLPEEKIEYGATYSIAGNPTPSRMVIQLVYLDKNANPIIKDTVETDGSVSLLTIPDFVRRKAKHYPQGDYEIRCFAYDGDGNESKASVKVDLTAPGSEAERRWR